jgi:hypothetical protein
MPLLQGMGSRRKWSLTCLDEVPQLDYLSLCSIEYEMEHVFSCANGCVDIIQKSTLGGNDNLKAYLDLLRRRGQVLVKFLSLHSTKSRVANVKYLTWLVHVHQSAAEEEVLTA